MLHRKQGTNARDLSRHASASICLSWCVCVCAGSVTSGVGPPAYITTLFCKPTNPAPLCISRGTAPLYLPNIRTSLLCPQTRTACTVDSWLRACHINHHERANKSLALWISDTCSGNLTSLAVTASPRAVLYCRTVQTIRKADCRGRYADKMAERFGTL